MTRTIKDNSVDANNFLKNNLNFQIKESERNNFYGKKLNLVVSNIFIFDKNLIIRHLISWNHNLLMKQLGKQKEQKKREQKK